MPLTPTPTRWRFFVAALSGAGITDYSKLAMNRGVTTVLNRPCQMSGKLPSSAQQVWQAYSDAYADPYLDEGTRLMWGFRRESDTTPYYVCRGGTLVQLVTDEAEGNDATTSFVGYDPWQYLMSRPVVDINGKLPGDRGLRWANTQAAVIIAQVLRNTISNQGHAYIDAGDGSRIGEGSQYDDWGGTAEYAGTLETGAGMSIDLFVAERGMTVGDVWQQIVDDNYCDIVLTPIYDPMNRPNYLSELNVYAQAGTTRDECMFAWGAPGRNVTSMTRTTEGGVTRANVMKLFTGMSGSRSEVPTIQDAASVAKFGQYWAMQTLTDVRNEAGIVGLEGYAAAALTIRANGRTLVTFKPTPLRAPSPWTDYQLGDRVPVFAKATDFRKALSDQSGPLYSRIYGWTTNIDDNSMETVEIVATVGQA